MNIDEYSFHDSRILSVTENTQEHFLDFLLDFPTNWEDNIFEPKILRFTEVIFYTIDEISFFGQPTILNIVNLGEITKTFGTDRNQIIAVRTKIEIQTNVGSRVIEFKKCDLLEVTNSKNVEKTEYKDQNIIDLLKCRDGLETKVELKNSKKISIWNIAWGYDIGDEYAHITTNISPNIDNSTIDFFYTNEIEKIITE